MKKPKCIIYNDYLTSVVNLGDHYVSDFVDKDNIYSRDKCPLHIGIGEKSGLAQLMNEYPQDKMYRKYWYKSGINETMKEALKDIVNASKKYVEVNNDDIVIDIASNDGTLLKYWNDSIIKVGIDPSNIAYESDIYNTKNINLLNDFFSDTLYFNSYNKCAKVITCVAMFYDTNNPVEFINQVKNCLSDDGLLILQISYTPLMLLQNAFDNIVHEHLAYYTLQSIKHVFDLNDMEIIDVDINDVNAGSFRLYVIKKGSKNKLNVPQHTFDVGEYKFKSVMEYEKQICYDNVQVFINFMSRIDKLKAKTIEWLIKQRENKKIVIGYGASTKSNTLLQYYNINSDILPFIADRNESKHGLFTVGSGIPIISEEDMRQIKPDYLIAFPWQFIRHFMKREEDLLNKGTQFVVPLPELRICSNQE